MHSASTFAPVDLRPDGVAVDEPNLFDNSILDPRASGRPWSAVDPPLATVPPSSLEHATETEDGVRAEEACHDEVFDPSDSVPEAMEASPDVDSPTSLGDLDDVPPEPSSVLERADLDSDIDMTLDASASRTPTPSDEPATPQTEAGRPAEPISATTQGRGAQAPEEELAGPLFACSTPSCGAASEGPARAAKPAAAPKRIGSGCLVPARLTWKPRDPFAGRSPSRMQRFRWELMLTSACITAVCGLGCVWLLRTLLA